MVKLNELLLKEWKMTDKKLAWVDLVKNVVNMSDTLDKEIELLNNQINTVKRTGRNQLATKVKIYRDQLKKEIKTFTKSEVARLRRQIKNKEMAKNELNKRMDVNIRELALHGDEPGVEMNPIPVVDDYGVITWSTK